MVANPPRFRYLCSQSQSMFMKKISSKKSVRSSAPLSPRDHIRKLIEEMSRNVYEKEQIIAVALLSAIAGENLFLLGPPGTAKSMVASRLKSAMKDARSFDYLMSRFSTPDEIFGPVSISRLKDADRYERLTEGYLPEAEVVFLDEIWKAGPSIQNTLLTAINEHRFYNGGKVQQVPMKILIAASNELPAPDEGLEALWDRFLMRMVSNCIENDSNFFRMLTSDGKEDCAITPELLIDSELYYRWQSESRNVTMSDDVTAAIRCLRRTFSRLEKQDGGKLRFYISDRRWRKAYNLMQTSAFLNDRDKIDLSDFFLLLHAFWNDVDSIPSVIDAFSEAITESLRNTLAMIERNIRLSMKPRKQGETEAKPPVNITAQPEFQEFDYFYYKITDHPEGEIYFSKWDYQTLSDVPREAVKYFDEKRRRIFLHALMPGSEFDQARQNAVNIKRVRLRKCSGGVIIDSTPYSFAKKAASASDASSLQEMPVYQRVDAMNASLRDTIASWNATMEATWHHSPNIFLSAADLKLADKAIKEAAQLIKTTEVKLKNLGLML